MITIHPPAPAPNVNGYTPRYVSPHGHLSGLSDRLAAVVERLRTDRTLPFVGLGLVEDLEAVLKLLNLREFAEWLRVNGAPEHGRWADDILDLEQIGESFEAVQDAVRSASWTTEEDPVRAVEVMDGEIERLQEAHEEIRRVLIQCGALAADDEQTDIPSLIRALLS